MRQAVVTDLSKALRAEQLNQSAITVFINRDIDFRRDTWLLKVFNKIFLVTKNFEREKTILEVKHFKIKYLFPVVTAQPIGSYVYFYQTFSIITTSNPLEKIFFM